MAANKRNRFKCEGMAIPLAVLAMILLMVTGGALLALGFQTRVYQVRTSSDIVARCAADAGLTKAIFEMNEKLKVEPWNDSTLPQATDEALPGCDAVFSYTVTGNSSTGYTIQSTGVFNQAEKKVYSTLKTQSPLFGDNFFSQNGFDLHNSVTVDGYDSNDGLYGGSNKGPTSLGTNSTETNPKAITLGNDVLITGDVIVGPGGNPEDIIELSNGAEITGQTSAAEEEKELPSISPPSLSYKGSEPTGTISSSGRYDEIKLSDSEKLTIDGDVVLVIDNAVEIDNGAILEVTEGSSLKLYIGVNFKITNSGHINNLTKKPPQCKIYSTASSGVQYLWDNDSVFYGAVYAPKAFIEVKNDSRMFGALIGDSIKLDDSAELHGDEALKKGSVDDYGAEFVINRWQE